MRFDTTRKQVLRLRLHQVLVWLLFSSIRLVTLAGIPDPKTPRNLLEVDACYGKSTDWCCAFLYIYEWKYISRALVAIPHEKLFEVVLRTLISESEIAYGPPGDSRFGVRAAEHSCIPQCPGGDWQTDRATFRCILASGNPFVKDFDADRPLRTTFAWWIECRYDERILVYDAVAKVDGRLIDKAKCVDKAAYKRLIRKQQSDCLTGTAKQGLKQLSQLVAWATRGDEGPLIAVPNIHIKAKRKAEELVYATKNWVSVLEADINRVADDVKDLAGEVQACMTAGPHLDATLHFSVTSANGDGQQD